MNDPSPATAISPLRQRLIDDMNVRRFSRETQRNYIRDVGRFATFLRRSPDTATADDVRRFQIEQRDAGVPTPTMNSIVSALQSSSRTRSTGPTWRCKADPGGASAQPARGAELTGTRLPRLLNATTCLKHQAALSVAYGAGTCAWPRSRRSRSPISTASAC